MDMMGKGGKYLGLLGWANAKTSFGYYFYSSSLGDACGDNDTQMRDATGVDDR